MNQSSNKHLFLKGFLILQTLAVLVYTLIAISNEGPNFFSKALGFVSSLTWMGQFTLDFNAYLMLSALWILWRNKFSGASIFFAIIANILGIIVLAPYLLFLINEEKGDLKRVLVGDR